jgi:hypothetical protein
MFLFDNNDKNIAGIKEAKQIELMDGSSITITGYKVSGQFIQVVVAEKASTYQDRAGYPNVIFLR